MNRKQQEIGQWILRVMNEKNQKNDVINHVITNNEESFNNNKRELKDVYFINTQQKIDQKTQKSTGIQQKRQKLKEGKCFICDEKGHRMKECKWKIEFRKHERYCQKYCLDVWEKWKELWLLLH